jgi:hypothetical protein
MTSRQEKKNNSISENVVIFQIFGKDPPPKKEIKIKLKLIILISENTCKN